MANTKWSAWWHNSNKCLFFYSSSTFSELKTKKEQKQTNMVLCIYSKTISHPWPCSQIIDFPKGRKRNVIISLWILFIEGFTCTYIHLCTQCVCVCVVCAVTALPCKLIPPPSPSPSPSPTITQTYTDLWNRMYKSLCLALNSAGP